MAEISYRRHRFPPIVIQHAVWLYLRFTLSYRDVEELLAERGLDISYESVRSWVLKFGPMIARRLRQVRPRPSDRWHLDEMVVRIAGKRMYLWRAVDHEGEILEVLVQRRRERRAAVKLMRKLMRKQGLAPKTVVTDCLSEVRKSARGGAISAGTCRPRRSSRDSPPTRGCVRTEDAREALQQRRPRILMPVPGRERAAPKLLYLYGGTESLKLSCSRPAR